MKSHTDNPRTPAPLGREGFVPKVMIVDDDEAHLQFIRMVILKENFTCELTLCSDPLDAMDKLHEDPPDLLLLDMMMPKMDGFEIIGQLRDDPATREIPVIFLTSTQETDQVVRAYEAGAVDYISKPINSSVLAVRIQSILQRIALENELKLRNQELLQINRFKDELLSICSHDLRSPLAAIEVICGSLTRNGLVESDTESKPLIDRIVNQSRLARRLVENLLDYNRIEEGMLVPEPSFFPVREFVLACAEQEQPMVQDKGLHLSVEAGDENLLAFGDRELLAQAVRNILGNAVKYAAGSIQLVAEPVHITPAGGGSLRISVSDDGAGIAPGSEREIFGKYAKCETSQVGSGLGLYIASKAAEAHGGRLSVNSLPGKRTTFTLDVPNAFRREQLPDLSTLSEVEGLILSPSKITGQLLESVLVEAGMVNVATGSTEEADTESPPHARAKFAVYDLSSAEPNYFKLANLINQAGAPTARIFYGPTDGVETLAKIIRAPFSHLRSPLNPLVFLNLILELMGEHKIKMRREGEKIV